MEIDTRNLDEVQYCIDVIELAIDWNLPITDEEFSLYLKCLDLRTLYEKSLSDIAQ